MNRILLSLFSVTIMVTNGWSQCPHLWWRFLLLPFGWDFSVWRMGRRGYGTISIFGFVFTICRHINA